RCIQRDLAVRGAQQQARPALSGVRIGHLPARAGARPLQVAAGSTGGAKDGDEQQVRRRDAGPLEQRPGHRISIEREHGDDGVRVSTTGSEGPRKAAAQQAGCKLLPAIAAQVRGAAPHANAPAEVLRVDATRRVPTHSKKRLGRRRKRVWNGEYGTYFGSHTRARSQWPGRSARLKPTRPLERSNLLKAPQRVTGAGVRPAPSSDGRGCSCTAGFKG